MDALKHEPFILTDDYSKGFVPVPSLHLLTRPRLLQAPPLRRVHIHGGKEMMLEKLSGGTAHIIPSTDISGPIGRADKVVTSHGQKGVCYAIQKGKIPRG